MLTFSKKNKCYTILILMIVLCTLLAVDTYSRYYSQSDSESGVKVAPWIFKMNGVSDSKVEVNLIDTLDSDNKYSSTSVIPGSSGVISFNVDCTDSKVALDYSIIVDTNNSVLPENLKLYTDSDYTTEFSKIDGFIGLDDVKTKTYNVYWKWNYTTTDETENWSNESIKLYFITSAVQRIDGDNGV